MVEEVKYREKKIKEIYHFKKYSFSMIEIKHLIIAFIFTLITIMIMQNKSGFIFTIGGFIELFSLKNLIAYTFAMISGFIFHEFGHKISAQYFNFRSEFRADFTMLFAVLLIALFSPLILLAPGAVIVVGRPNLIINGIISICGPLVNLFNAVFIILLSLIFSPNPNGLFYHILSVSFIVNVILGIFNMLPFWVLDGKKVFMWNKTYYFLTMGSLVFLFLNYRLFF